MSFTKSLPLVAFVLAALALAFTSTHATNFAITNHCSYTVWAAATTGGRSLDPGQTWSADFNPDIQRVWGRTGCNFDGSGQGTCQTGSCGDLLECNPSVSAQPPVTLCEFTLDGGGGNDYYDISVVDGYNLPLSFNPTNGACTQLTCTSSDCPDAYLYSGDTKTKACPTGSTSYTITFCP